jgi:hypothetical protein
MFDYRRRSNDGLYKYSEQLATLPSRSDLPVATISKPPPEVSIDEKVDESPQSPNSFSLSTHMMDCDDSLGSLHSVAPCSIGEELHQSIKLLSPALLTDENVFSGVDTSSGFGDQTNNVYDFLRVAIKNYQVGGTAFPSSLYVCGGPGTGKVS